MDKDMKQIYSQPRIGGHYGRILLDNGSKELPQSHRQIRKRYFNFTKMEVQKVL